MLLASGAALAETQARDPASEAQQIFTSVMSPFCPGLLLADCPSPAAFELRASIRKRLEAGETPADIERDLYRQYGDSIRAVPPARGWGRVLWLAPPLLLLLSLALLTGFLARHSASAAPPSEPKRDAAMEERLDHELDELR